MIVISKEMDSKVLEALSRGYSDHQVARMYGLRVATVRRIEGEYARTDLSAFYSGTKRFKQTPLDIGQRLHEDLFQQDLSKISHAVTGRYQVRNADYAGLEARVMAGFFTPDGVPTPAFWGFLSQYTKKSGHAMLDMLHDHEIYAPEQLKRALDIDSQIADMSQVELVALLRRISTTVYANAIKDPTDPCTDVSDGE